MAQEISEVEHRRKHLLKEWKGLLDEIDEMQRRAEALRKELEKMGVEVG